MGAPLYRRVVEKMKTRILLTVNEFERYVIARYWGVAASTPQDKTRTRATRQQGREFAHAALRAAVKEQAEALRGREKATAKRLAQPQSDDTVLVRPDEHQLNLTW